jgi:hypothetical protein
VLTEEDKKYLDDLMKSDVFDPRGAQRVQATIAARDIRHRSNDVRISAWLVRGDDGKPARLYLRTGICIPETDAKEIAPGDFLAEHRAGSNPCLLDAAWLYRIGDGRAAMALANARHQFNDPRQHLREMLAVEAFEASVAAYLVHADAEALLNGERVMQICGQRIPEEVRQTPLLVAALRNRQIDGRFGKLPLDEPPEAFQRWDMQTKVKYLIESLDEVDSREWNFLRGDWRIGDLIGIGDAAVPALIEALENDGRLTHSLRLYDLPPPKHGLMGSQAFDYDSVPLNCQTISSVREVVLPILRRILRSTKFRQPRGTEGLHHRDDDWARQSAPEFRKYWSDYGKLPFAERMMRIITEPRSDSEERREAVDNISNLEGGKFGLVPRLDESVTLNCPLRRPDAKLIRFTQPTVAEAVLNGLDRELHDFPPADSAGLDSSFSGIEDRYLTALVRINDGNIAPVLATRAASRPTVRSRCAWAYTAVRLGNADAIKSLALDLANAKIKFPQRPENASILHEVICRLLAVRVPESKNALDSLLISKHPQHRLAFTALVEAPLKEPRWVHSLWSDAYALKLLREFLNETELTERFYVAREDGMVTVEKGKARVEDLPDFLSDKSSTRDKAGERICDIAAKLFRDHALGVPPYHCLAKDAEARLASIKAYYDRFGGQFRLLNDDEIIAMKLLAEAETRFLHFSTHFLYVPDIRPLGRPATADDVKSGKALFHLAGKGRVAPIALPAVGFWKRNGAADTSKPVLIAQAEIAADGKTVFGVIERDCVHSVGGDELTEVKPIRVQVDGPLN